MNDPHVQRLFYELRCPSDVVFEQPPPLDHESFDARFNLDRGTLMVEPTRHFAEVSEARAVIEPFLRTWEIHDALVHGRQNLHFEYLSAHVVDRASPAHAAGATGLASLTLTATATVTSIRRAYPNPPTGFVVTPLVEALYHAHQSALRDKRVAVAAGYFALTAVKTRVRDSTWTERGRARTARIASVLVVDPVILERLHDLTTNAGDLSTTRKVSDKAEFDRPRPAHTLEDVDWICSTIRRLAIRLGEWEAGSTDLELLKA